jgi:hypothetical protein
MVKFYCDACHREISGQPAAEKVDSERRSWHLCHLCVAFEYALLEGQEIINGVGRRRIVPVIRRKLGAHPILL